MPEERVLSRYGTYRRPPPGSIESGCRGLRECGWRGDPEIQPRCGPGLVFGRGKISAERFCGAVSRGALTDW